MLAVTLILSALVCEPPSPQQAWVVLDTQLRPNIGALQAITSEGVTWIGGDNQVHTLPLDRTAAIVREREWLPEPVATAAKPGAQGDRPPQQLGAIELVDGSRLVGALFPRPVSGDVASWVYPGLGRITFALDRVRRIALNIDAARWNESLGPTAAAGTRDTLILVNGDRLEGFVAGVQVAPEAEEKDGEPHVRIEVDGKGRLIPLSRISEVRLVNPAKASGGARAWLSDGGVLALGRVEMAEPLSFTMTIDREPGKPGPWSVGLDSVRGVAIDSARLTPLSTIACEVDGSTSGTDASKKRRWSAPPRLWQAGTLEAPSILGAADVLLPGPMSVRWTVPTGAAHVGGWMLLPPDCREWGDCVVTLRLDGAPIVQQRLNAQKPSVRFDSAVPAGTKVMTVTIDPGEYGPIQDRVVLRKAIFVGK